jgi:membrane protein
MQDAVQGAQGKTSNHGNRQGRDAHSPWQMGWPAWKQVLLRTWREAGDDNVGLIAAGVAFYSFLALVPLLGAVVLSYGLIADPGDVINHVRGLMSVMPAQAAKLIGEQLLNVVQSSDGKKGFGLLLALGVALFGARNAAGAIVTALNIAYEEKEKRSFIIVNLLSIAITAAGVLLTVVAMVSIAALGHLRQMLPTLPTLPTLPEPVLILGNVASYVVLLLGGAAVAATLYRYGPSRDRPRWVWLTPGSIMAALLGLLLTIGFGIYVANFGSYNATYGSLGAVVVMLTWMYLSSYVLLFCAELNSELEHQTAKDTTEGAPQPIGARGAWGADHVAGEPGAASHDRTKTRPAREATIGDSPPHDSMIGSAFGTLAGTGIGRLAGGRKVGTIGAALGTAGLMLVRRPGRAPLGLAMMACAATLAMVGRDDVEEGA